MKKQLLVSALLISAFIITGCGKTPEVVQKASDISDAMKAGNELANLGKSLDANNPEDQAKAIEKIAQVGADFEVKELERTEAIDLPAPISKDLVYSGGKVTSGSDNTQDTSISANATVKTLDEAKKVKEFYKKLLSENGWKITSQSNDANNSRFDANKDGGKETLNVSISNNQYSKITEISLNYYDYRKSQ